MLIVGITTTIQEGQKKNLPKSAPLATILLGDCSNIQIAPFGTSLLASWGWEVSAEDSGGQTKFGGDAALKLKLLAPAMVLFWVFAVPLWL